MSNSRPTSANPTRQQLDELDALLQRMLDLPVNRLEGDLGPEPGAAPPSDTAAPPAAPSSQPVTAPLPPSDEQRPRDTYPACYMVVETATPTFTPPPPDEVPASPPAEPGRPGTSPNGTPPNGTPPQDGAGDAEWVPLRSSWQPSAHTWQPLAKTWQQAQTPAAAPAAGAKASVASALGELPAPAAATGPGVRSVSGPSQPAREGPTPSAPAGGGAPPLPWWLLPLAWFNRVFDACVGACGAPGRWLLGPTGRTILGTLGLLFLAAAVALAVADGIGWIR